MEILRQIQSDLIDATVALSTILRKAKVLASQLRSQELGNWVAQELDGYKTDDTLPDYRIIKTGCVGKWTNGHWMVNQRGVPLSKIKNEDLKEFLTTFTLRDGIRSVEHLAVEEDKHFVLGSDIVSFVNHYVAEAGYGYMEIEYAVGNHEFEQVLDTVRNRLLDLVLKLDEKWATNRTPSKDEVSKLVSVVIYNNPQGGSMSVFDQRGQQVHYQYNAAGDISIGSAKDKDSLAGELEKLRHEVEQARYCGVVDADVAVEADYHLLQAMKEARKEQPSKKTFLGHVETAKGLLENVTAVGGLVGALVKSIEVAKSIFG